MRPPPPPMPTEGRPRLPDFPQASARASVRSTWKRWAMHEFLAGRSTEAAAAYLEALRGVRGQPLREAHLALKQTLVEQRRGHYSNALRRASLGLRAVRDATGPEAGAVRARLQVRYAVCRVQQGRYADARRWAERGLAEAEAAHELKAQAKAHAVLHAGRGVVGRTQKPSGTGRRRCASSRSLGTSPSRPIC